jgi:two-component system NtrC family sensor kinase
VLTNLLINATDAMAESGGTLTVHLETLGQRLRLHVEDTGVGIPAERLERVFQPFFTTKLGNGGTGLGLSISYEIVRRHGGELSVRSCPGRGSVFTIELPLAPATGSLS